MRIRWRKSASLIVLIAGLGGSITARADLVVNGSFGPNGDVGFVNSPPTLSISFGADGQGSIFQMDGFVNIPGRDLGAGSGKSAQLTNGAPPGLTYIFGSTQPTPSQLILTYTFVNNTGASLPGFQFLYFADPDIGANFANDSAAVHGANQLGLPNPTSFQVGDPSLSTIFTNLTNGTLSNINEQPSTKPGDVSMGLGFTAGTLGIGQTASFEIMLSDNGSHLGNFYIDQSNPANPGDILTVSGIAVPEPASLISLVVGIGSCLAFARMRPGRVQAWTRSQ